MKVEVLSPHGFCAGVTGALRRALSLGGRTWCLHELVHNELVVADLRRRGFVFVDDVAEVPEGETVLFSAHGVSPSVRRAAASRRLAVIDATCPFVERVHVAARDFALRGLAVVVIGNPNHVEARGIVGEVEDVGGRFAVIGSLEESLALSGLGGRIAVVSQTTMNADAVREIVASLRSRFEVETMAEVCQATKVRQDAVRAFSGDGLLVLGSATSSNTRRLCEVARCRTFRAGSLEEVKGIDFSGVEILGVTSGASTPESFLELAVLHLKRHC